VLLQRVAVAEVAPVPLVALRLVCAALVLLPFAGRLRQAIAGRPRLILDFFAIGVLNPVLSGAFTALALQRASSGVVAVLQTLSPIATAAVAYVFLREETPGWQRLCGLLVALGGVALLVVTGTSGLPGESTGDVSGLLFALAGPLTVSVAAVYVRRNLSGISALVTASGQITAACLVAVIVAMLAGGQVTLADISSRVWFAIFLSGAIGLSASFVLFVRMIGRHGPTAAVLATYVMPVVATLLGVMILGETITPPMLAGSLLVLVGVVVFSQAR
jgi:drug/metabolite transporter (DMT)-like permease